MRVISATFLRPSYTPLNLEGENFSVPFHYAQWRRPIVPPARGKIQSRIPC